MVGWSHGLNGHEFKQTPGDSEGQGSLESCSPWGHKKLGTTQSLNNYPVVGSEVKNPPGNAPDGESIPGSGRLPGERNGNPAHYFCLGNGNPLQYSCLGKRMDRGVWWATVHVFEKESDRTQRLNNNPVVYLLPSETMLYYANSREMLHFLERVEGRKIGQQQQQAGGALDKDISVIPRKRVTESRGQEISDNDY